jgi:hypothetical protein
VLELAADLRFLDEPAADVGIVAPLVEQHLDGQVAAKVGVAALEDRSHAPFVDLAQDLVAAGIVGPLGRRRPDHGGLGPVVRVAEQDAGNLAERSLERLQHALVRDLLVPTSRHSGRAGV